MHGHVCDPLVGWTSSSKFGVPRVAISLLQLLVATILGGLMRCLKYDYFQSGHFTACIGIPTVNDSVYEYIVKRTL